MYPKPLAVMVGQNLSLMQCNLSTALLNFSVSFARFCDCRVSSTFMNLFLVPAPPYRMLSR